MKKKEGNKKTQKNKKSFSKGHKRKNNHSLRKTFEDWYIKHHKGALIFYYSAATVVIAISSIIILDNLVTKTEVLESEKPIYPNIEYVDDNNLELGTEEIAQAGEDGVEKIYTEEKKRLITGEVIDSNIVNTEISKEPIKKIIRRGTRKWQYMICSDGSYRYYTDEQFKDPRTGFTHSSEDHCAKNSQGAMIGLADFPPAPSAYTRDGRLSEAYIRAMEISSEYEQELRNKDLGNTSATEPFESSVNYNPFAENEARMEQERQAMEAAENYCRSQAEGARRGAIRQLGAMGVNGSQLTTVPQSAYDSTYYSCMRNYGY